MPDILKPITRPEQDLFNEISKLIEQSQQQLAVQVNSTLTMLFWQIGDRINKNF
jgi:hypothetical protein